MYSSFNLLESSQMLTAAHVWGCAYLWLHWFVSLLCEGKKRNVLFLHKYNREKMQPHVIFSSCSRLFRTYNVQTCKVQQVVLPWHLKRHSAGGVLLIGQLDVVTVHWAFTWGAPLFSQDIVSFHFDLIFVHSNVKVNLDFWWLTEPSAHPVFELAPPSRVALKLPHWSRAYVERLESRCDLRSPEKQTNKQKTEMCNVTNVLFWLQGSHFQFNSLKDAWFIYHRSHLSSAL